jgi:hypothetical protein
MIAPALGLDMREDVNVTEDVSKISTFQEIIFCLFLQNVVLKDSPGGPSPAYKMWMKPTVPIYMQFYVFHLENPAEVINGEKPFLMQRGPYTYRYTCHRVLPMPTLMLTS